MHYFKRNIGDYHKKAGRLSMLEHGAYTLLIDACYDREIFPTIEQALDWCWARTNEEIAAVKFVLDKFFDLNDGVYSQNRIKEEIENYHNNSRLNKEIAIERERKRKESKARSEHEPCTDEHEPPPNHKPLTINQEPRTNIIVQDADAPSPLGVLITNKKDETFPVYQTDFDLWQETYQAVDVLQELKKIKSWLDANPTKRKTKSGMKRFINTWLSRAQDNPAKQNAQQGNRVSVISDFLKNDNFDFN